MSADITMGAAPQSMPQSSSRFGGLAPLILGFVAPLLVLLFIDPPFIREARGLLVIFMAFVGAAVSLLFLFAVFVPKALTSITIDPQRASLVLISENGLATTEDLVRLSDIRRVSVVSSYDKDGYPEGAGEIIMRTGDRIPLPFAPPADVVSSFRG